MGFTYVDKAGYDEFGQRAYMKLGNGVETMYEYDENRRWLKGIQTVRENAVLQGITYSFDAVGNVLGYANKAGGYETEQKYTYDDLYQLTGADGESKSYRYGMLEYMSMYSQEYQFDGEGLGNMTLKRSETANTQQRLLGDPLKYELQYEYEKGYAHRASKIGSKYYKYNLNGSVTGVQDRPFEAEAAHGKAVVNDLGGGAYSTEGGWALNEPKAGGTTSSSSTQSLKEYRWDERNRLAYSNDERYGVRYAYGEDGERTGKWATSHVGGESETLYFGKLWSWHYDGMAGDYTGMNSKHVFLGETRIATKAVYADGSFIEHAQKERQYYYHSDHLGSAQLITDYKGDEYERIEYTPYGELWIEKASAVSALDVAYRFTGKELDRETGLYYYGARYLDPRESRWLSVDPAMGEYVPQAPVNDEARRYNQNLPGMGGVFNTVNLHVYHYAGNNPVKYIDPDGETPKFPTFNNAINLDFGRDYMGLAYANFKEGEYGWATAMVADAIFEAAYDLLVAYKAASAIGFIVTVIGNLAAPASEKGVELVQKRISVIGPRATYREFAKNIGANFLNLTDEEWSLVKNLEYINDIIQRGDDVLFAGKFDPAKLDPESKLALEIKLLIEAGYKWTEDFTKLVKK